MNDITNMTIFSDNMLQNLFLLPYSHRISCDSTEAHALLRASRIFRRLHDLEVSIHPILIQMEERGLLLSYSWFEDGMQSTREALNQITNEIGGYVPIKANFFNEEDIVYFLKENNLPVATGMKDLQKYREFHRLYKLLLIYKAKTQFYQQWGNT